MEPAKVASSASDCQSRCMALPACNFWSMELVYYYCHLKATRTRAIFKLGSISGGVDCTLPDCNAGGGQDCPETDCLFFKTYYPGATLQSYITEINLLMCKQTCMDDEECGMISFDSNSQQCLVYSNQFPLGNPGSLNTFIAIPRDCPAMSEYSKFLFQLLI